MKQSSGQNPRGSEYRIRLTVRDEMMKTQLHTLSSDSHRRRMPDFFYVVSQQGFIHHPTDFYDGVSASELQLQMYKRQLNDYNRNTFHADSYFVIDDERLSLKASLGIEAAKRVFAPPFAEPSDDTLLEVYYKIPGVDGDIDEMAVDALRDYIHTRPRNAYTDIRLVTPQTLRKEIVSHSRI